MSRFSDTVRDDIGRLVPNALVYVFDWDAPSESTGALSALTDDDLTTPLSNPLTTDEFGQFYFNSTNGVKLLEYHYASKLQYRAQIILTPAGFYPGNDAALRADLAATGGAALIANNGGGTIQDASFVKGPTTPTIGSVAAIQWKREGTSPSYPVQSLAGLWPADKVSWGHAISAEWDATTAPASAPSDSPSSTLTIAAQNKGTDTTCLALQTITGVQASGKEAAGVNFITYSGPSLTGVKMKGLEIDIQPHSTTALANGFGIAINAFTKEIPGDAIYIEGVFSGSWSSGIRIGKLNAAAGAGLYAGSGSMMGALVDTALGTYGQDAIVLSNTHKIRFEGTASVHAKLYVDGSNIFHLVMPSAGYSFRDATDASSLVSITDNSSNGRISIAGASGDIQINGNKVVGARQTSTAANATDLATAIALVNDLKAKLVAHGLIS